MEPQLTETKISPIESLIQFTLEHKWMLIIAGGVVLFIMTVMMLFTDTAEKSPSDIDNAPSQTISAPVTQSVGTLLPTVSPTLTVELRAAVNEAKKASEEYATTQDNVRQEYPWIRKFPFSNGKYFIYFDTDRQLFVGKLYPAAGDDIEQIKAQARQNLIDREVPPDAFPYEWLVFPQ